MPDTFNHEKKVTPLLEIFNLVNVLSSLWSFFKNSKVFWSLFETFKDLESYNLKILNYITIA